MDWFSYNSKSCPSYSFCICPYFHGLMTALHPTFCSWIAELILLTWGESSQHHSQCHSAVPGPFHSKTLLLLFYFPNILNAPTKGCTTAYTLMHSWVLFLLARNWHRRKGSCTWLMLSQSCLLEELRNSVGSTGHTTRLPEADQVPTQRPGHHCTRGDLQSFLQVSLYMFVHSTALLLLSRASVNYSISGIWDHISTATERILLG